MGCVCWRDWSIGPDEVGGEQIDTERMCGSDCGCECHGPTCPECGEVKPDDERVAAGMKCGECTGYTEGA